MRVTPWKKNEGDFSKSPGTLEVMETSLPGKENRASKASNALNGWLVRFYMKGTIGRLPGLFEKLRMKHLHG